MAYLFHLHVFYMTNAAGVVFPRILNITYVSSAMCNIHDNTDFIFYLYNIFFIIILYSYAYNPWLD